MFNKTNYLAEDLDGQLGRDMATTVLIKNLPNLPSPCLCLDPGAGDLQQALSKQGIQVTAVNTLFHNHDAALKRSKKQWIEWVGDENHLPAQKFAAGLFRLSKSTERNLHILQQMWTALTPGAPLLIYGPGDEGIKGFQHKLERAGLEVEILALGKGCRVLAIQVQGAAPLVASEQSFEFQGKIFPTPPGVFSAAKLDGGTQVLLEHIPSLKGQKVIDLGCGCGIISWAAIQKGAKGVIACDVFGPSVRATQKLLADEKNFEGAQWDFAGNSQKAFKADLILTNPPFHQEKRMNHRIGIRWLEACERLLKDGGQVILVANRFLDYPSYAKDIFSEIQEIGGDRSFRVLRMIKLKPDVDSEYDKWISMN